jgi:hypothetical protein
MDGCFARALHQEFKQAVVRAGLQPVMVVADNAPGVNFPVIGAMGRAECNEHPSARIWSHAVNHRRHRKIDTRIQKGV